MGVWLRKSSHRFHSKFAEVRLHKSSHRFHGFAQMAWLRLFSHGFHRSTQMVGCVCSPTEFTEFTEVWGCCWLRGYGRMPYPPNLCASVRICGRCFSARRFCAFRGFCGNIVSHGFHRSTQMVGCVNSPTDFTEFTEVWGCCWQRGYGRMPYPPNLCASVGATSQPEGSVCSVRSVGGFSRPEECQSVGTSTLPEGSVGDYSFSMRKRLTMPKTRA